MDLRVDYVNISELDNQFDSTSPEFLKYVNDDGTNLTLNLTSNSYANLTLTITPIGQIEAGKYTFNIELLSRTERVYRTTFALTVEDMN